MKKLTTTISKSVPNQEFMDRLGKYSVRIDRSTMDMKMLEILVNHGLNTDDNMKKELDNYNEALNNAKKGFDNKKETERRIIQDDAKHLEEVLAFKKLNELYG